MGWVLHFPDEVDVDFDDLSPDAFASIAKEVDAGLTYWGIYMFPKESPDILYRVVEAAARHAGVEPPERPSNMREQKALDAMLEKTDDIGEQPMMDGFPPVPGETELGSSSTSPGLPTDGPEVSPENSPSDGS